MESGEGKRWKCDEEKEEEDTPMPTLPPSPPPPPVMVPEQLPPTSTPPTHTPPLTPLTPLAITALAPPPVVVGSPILLRLLLPQQGREGDTDTDMEKAEALVMRWIGEMGGVEGVVLGEGVFIRGVMI